jgi:hypothetical protein
MRKKWAKLGVMMGQIPSFILAWTFAGTIHNSFLCGGCFSLFFILFLFFFIVFLSIFYFIGLKIDHILSKK